MWSWLSSWASNFDRVGPLLSSEVVRARVGGLGVADDGAVGERRADGGHLGAEVCPRGPRPSPSPRRPRSQLCNVEHGDGTRSGSSSSGRPRAGVPAEQILNPYYSINTFCDALARVDGYESMKVTEAAQLVQRSAFPEAYADHEADARVLASALTGSSPVPSRVWSTTTASAGPTGEDRTHPPRRRRTPRSRRRLR